MDPRNAQRLSEVLIHEFGSLYRLLSREPEAWNSSLGDQKDVSALLSATKAILCEQESSALAGTRLRPSDRRLANYLQRTMGSLAYEMLRVFFLDGAGLLLAEEEMARGSVHCLTIYPRTIFRRALEREAAQIILVHNHPGGSSLPSAEDIDLTHRMQDIGAALDVELLDHLVVTSREVRSVLAA